MMEEVNSPAYAMKIESSTKEKTDEQKEDLAYSTLNTTDLDDSSFRMDNISDDSDDDKEENGDLLEPFPEIDHDRRPRDADRNFFAEDEDDDDILRPGDHVYVWKSMGFFGVKTYQKHGIVLNVDPDDDTNVEIATFYHKNPRHKSFRRDDEDDFGNVDHYDLDNIKQPSDGNPKVPRGYSDQHYGCEQTQTLTSTPVQPETKTSSSYYDNAHESKMSSHSGNSTSFTNSPTAKKEPKFTATVRIESLASFASNAKSEIKKVKYNLSLAKRVLRSGGTVTSCKADEADLVVARARFLLDTNPESATKTVMGMGITGEEEYSRELEQSIPDFHMLSANGECAAVWCRTGRWCTLQGSSILHILIVSQAGGAVAGGAIASNIMLWAPMPGFWGSIGYIWYVPATIAFPILVPILIGFGLASLVPLEVLRRFRKKWAQITREMNTAFWSKADGEVRHNYASNDSTKESWVKDFFMDDATKKDKQKGSYMPLGSNGDDDIGIDDDSDEDDEFTKKVAAEYGMYSPNGEKGHKGKESEIEFSEKWKSTTKEEWQSLASKVNASAASEKDNNDKGSHRELV